MRNEEVECSEIVSRSGSGKTAADLQWLAMETVRTEGSSLKSHQGLVFALQSAKRFELVHRVWGLEIRPLSLDLFMDNPTWTQLLLGALISSRNYGLALAEHLDLQRPLTYTALGRMVQLGLVTAEKEDIDESAEARRARTYYEITEQGRRLHEQSLTRLLERR